MSEYPTVDEVRELLASLEGTDGEFSTTKTISAELTEDGCKTVASLCNHFLAQSAAPTEMPPTAPGYYWECGYSQERFHVVRILEHKGRLCADMGEDEPTPLTELQGSLWSGPLVSPWRKAKKQQISAGEFAGLVVRALWDRAIDWRASIASSPALADSFRLHALEDDNAARVIQLLAAEHNIEIVPPKDGA